MHVLAQWLALPSPSPPVHVTIDYLARARGDSDGPKWTDVVTAISTAVLALGVVLAAFQLRAYVDREKATATVALLDKYSQDVNERYQRWLFDMDPTVNAAQIMRAFESYRPGGAKHDTAEAIQFFEDMGKIVNYFSEAATLADHKVINEELLFEMVAVSIVTVYCSWMDVIAKLPEQSTFPELKNLAKRAQLYHETNSLHPRSGILQAIIR